MFDGVLQKFADRAPASVMVRGLLEHLLNAERLDTWFETSRERQYTRTLLFSSLVGLMLQVVCRVQGSVNAAYRHSAIAVSIVAVYDKLQGVELKTSQELVRWIGQESQAIIEQLGGERPALLPGYDIRYLDGNCLAGSEKRLKVLRGSAAAALPGKSLVVFNPRAGVVCDVFPCEDGHAQERALLPQVQARIRAGELWITDRNFCVSAFLVAIAAAKAACIIRHHAGRTVKPLGPLQPAGDSPSGPVFEQAVELYDEDGPRLWSGRRIVVKLHTPTRNGDRILALLTTLPPEVAAAPTVAELYRTRWTIETAFQKIEAHLNSELNTLGYPKAALFGFCLALVAFNLYAVVMAALRAAHPDTDIDDSVSEYYLAAEIANTTQGLNIAVEDEQWTRFAQADRTLLCALLLDLARRVDLHRLRKNKRGPKKPRTPRTQHKGKPHISTAKVLAGT